MSNFVLAKSRPVVYETNAVTAYNPEVWARETLMVLRNNMVAAQLVHQDFSTQVAQYGDIVNTRKPANFEGTRKTDADDVTVQNAEATNVAVPLDQHVHVSFFIRDGQASLAFKNLIDEFITPASIAMAQKIDQIVVGQSAQWLLNNSYVSGQLQAGATKNGIIDTRKKMNDNQCPLNMRNFLHSTNADADLLKIAEVLNADKIGDDGTKMREASIGRLWGFNHWMDQNVPYVSTSTDTVAGAVNNASGYAAGATTMTVDGFSAVITNGSFFTVEGDMTPQRVVSTVGDTTPTSITFTPGLNSAVENNAVVTIYEPGAVNLLAGYAAGYAKTIVYDGFTLDPQVGQMCAFGTTTNFYSIVEVNTTAKTIVLDRPLEASLTNDDPICLVPAGGYNFASHRNALALVTRPLALPQNDLGVRAAVADINGLSVRVTMTYNGTSQGTLVTLDMLAGVKVLDKALGCFLFS